jgi:hypothetical protein
MGCQILSHEILCLMIIIILFTAAKGLTLSILQLLLALPLQEMLDPELFLRIFLELLPNCFALKDLLSFLRSLFPKLRGAKVGVLLTEQRPPNTLSYSALLSLWLGK